MPIGGIERLFEAGRTAAFCGRRGGGGGGRGGEFFLAAPGGPGGGGPFGGGGGGLGLFGGGPEEGRTMVDALAMFAVDNVSGAFCFPKSIATVPNESDEADCCFGIQQTEQ